MYNARFNENVLGGGSVERKGEEHAQWLIRENGYFILGKQHFSKF